MGWGAGGRLEEGRFFKLVLCFLMYGLKVDSKNSSIFFILTYFNSTSSAIQEPPPVELLESH